MGVTCSRTSDGVVRLESVNEEKLTLLSNLSHDLNTSLSVIILGIDLLSEDENMSEKRRAVVHSVRAAYEQVLSLSRKTLFQLDGKAVPLVIAVCVREVVENAVDVIQQTTTIHISCVVDESVPAYTMTDHSWLLDVLLNLLNNAKKFTVRGEIDVFVTCADGFIRFEVRDTGCGVRPERVKKLFEPFSSDNAEFGTGLGLFSCRVRVLRLGGTIEYSPRADEKSGSVFSFCIPSAPIDLLAFSANTVLYKHFRVLVVDDSILLCKMLKRIFETYVECVEAVHNSVDAVDQAMRYDVVVTDYNLGTGNPADGLRRLRDAYDGYMCMSSGSVVAPPVAVEFYAKPLTTQTVQTILQSSVRFYGLHNVLVVDDELLICGLMLQLCRVNALEGVAAHDGGEALEVLGTDNPHKISLVLLDLNMAPMNGYQFLERLKLPRRCMPYIAVVTAYASEVDHPLVQVTMHKPIRGGDVMRLAERAAEYRVRQMRQS